MSDVAELNLTDVLNSLSDLDQVNLVVDLEGFPVTRSARLTKSHNSVVSIGSPNDSPTAFASTLSLKFHNANVGIIRGRELRY